MSKIKTYEEIAGLFQTWPATFKERFGRNITKDELEQIIQDKIREAQQYEIEDKFFDWDANSLKSALHFITKQNIEHVDDFKQEGQDYKITSKQKAKK